MLCSGSPNDDYAFETSDGELRFIEKCMDVINYVDGL
jgi:hypothetical protein